MNGPTRRTTSVTPSPSPATTSGSTASRSPASFTSAPATPFRPQSEMLLPLPRPALLPLSLRAMPRATTVPSARASLQRLSEQHSVPPVFVSTIPLRITTSTPPPATTSPSAMLFTAATSTVQTAVCRRRSRSRNAIASSLPPRPSTSLTTPTTATTIPPSTQALMGSHSPLPPRLPASLSSGVHVPCNFLLV